MCIEAGELDNEDFVQIIILASRSRKPKLTAVGIRCADHATPSVPKVGTSPTCGGRSVGIVRMRTKGHGVFLFLTTIRQR
jgi:hypothetical protein